MAKQQKRGCTLPGYGDSDMAGIALACGIGFVLTVFLSALDVTAMNHRAALWAALRVTALYGVGPGALLSFLLYWAMVAIKHHDGVSGKRRQRRRRAPSKDQPE